MCAGLDGQSTSGLKMEPKCITTDSDIGTGKPLCAPTRGRSIVREIQCAEGKDARRSECHCVMQWIRIQALSYPKGGRRLARV